MGWGEDRGRRFDDCSDLRLHRLDVVSGSCPCGAYKIVGAAAAERLVDRIEADDEPAP